MDRRERKYLLDRGELAVLEGRLRAVLAPDVHGERGGYHVRSLYFDDPDDTALFEKHAGISERHRWRLRIYDRSDRVVRLERKARLDRWMRKDGTVVARDTAERLIAGDRCASDDPLVRAFLVEQRVRRLRPVVRVEYHRQAFVHRSFQVRVTVDRRLRSGPPSLFVPDPPVIPVLDGDRRVILEIKSSGGLPSYLAELVPRTVRSAEALSKYALCRTCGGEVG